MKRINLSVDIEMYEWIRDNARQNRISMSQVIRNMFDVFTKRNEPHRSVKK